MSMDRTSELDQWRRLRDRSRQVADELEADAAAAAKRSAGLGSENALQKSWMLGYLAHDAGRRIAELEAWITANGLRLPGTIINEALTTTPGRADSAPTTPGSSRLSVAPAGAEGREAASHAERSK
jgi:hypothetical protein